MYQAVIFDLDGTLIDSGEGITSSVSYALNKLGIFEYDTSVLYRFIGPALHHSFERYFAMDEKTILLAVEYYRENYLAKGMYQNEMYEGMMDTLNELFRRKITMMVATAKPTFFATKIIKHMGMEHFFSKIEGNSLNSVHETKERIIKECVDALPQGIKALMVGDTHYDVSAAGDLGLDSAAASYGYGDMEELKKHRPTYFIHAPKELLKLI